MTKYRVYGIVVVSVSVEVEIKNVNCEDLMGVLAEAADDKFGSIDSFADNGGCDKLIGVYVSAGEIEWDDFEVLG